MELSPALVPTTKEPSVQIFSRREGIRAWQRAGQQGVTCQSQRASKSQRRCICRTASQRRPRFDLKRRKMPLTSSPLPSYSCSGQSCLQGVSLEHILFSTWFPSFLLTLNRLCISIFISCPIQFFARDSKRLERTVGLYTVPEPKEGGKEETW